jgi:hypothetical protein
MRDDPCSVNVSFFNEQTAEHTPALQAEKILENTEGAASHDIVVVLSFPSSLMTRNEFIRQNSTTKGSDNTLEVLSSNKSLRN